MAKTRATTKPTKRAARGAAPAMAVEAADVLGSQADYAAFIPAARKLGAADIVPMRADPQLALHNVQLGAASVLAEAGLSPSKVLAPELDAIAELPRLGLAVIFAATQLAPAGGAVTGLAPLLARGSALRALLLATAGVLALAGLIPQAEVDKIRAGHGSIDAARDLLALVALFGKHGAKVRGKHVVTAAQLKEASEVGTTLLKP